VLRRVGVAVAAAIAVSTLATSGGNAAAAADIDTEATAKVAIYDTFSGWCFANNLANSSLMAGRTIYETLFEKTTTNDLAGLLAVKGEALAGSGMKIWKVTLRTGIKFHDGTDFNAAAVVDNWKYGSSGVATDSKTYFGAILAEYSRLATALAGGSGPLVAGTVTTTAQVNAFDAAYKKEKAAGGIRAVEATAVKVATFSAAGKAKSVSALAYTLSTATAFSSNILWVQAVGTDTLYYFLDHAQNDFLGTTYASGRSFVRAPEQFKGGVGQDCVDNPIGTGPFKVEKKADWSPDKLKVVRNPNYWRKDALGNTLPYLKQITFTNIKETASRVNAVIRGTYDAAMFGSGDGKFNQSLRKSSKVAEIKSAYDYYPSLWLNQGKPNSPFSNKDARLAVMTCIDRVNFNKVRLANESKIAKSLVGPQSVMYSTLGFSDKLQIAKSKEFVAAYKTATGKKSLTFTIPSDTSTTSVANINFLVSTWKKCGITAVPKKEEAAKIIAKAFNASPDKDAGEYYNAYDAISILLMEGTDATFNMPFVLTNAYSTGSPATAGGTARKFASDAAATLDKVLPAGTGAALAPYLQMKADIFGPSLGSVLSLNHHSDTVVDDKFFAAEAAATDADAKAKFAEATAYLQGQGFMTSIAHGYYNMFYNKANGLTGFGELTLPDPAATATGLSSTGTVKQRKIANWGVDWTGVYKLKK
jgi:ABC-type transport system substrate-binding protein